MTRYTFHIAALAASCLLFSCNKDFLERPPQNQLSEGTFWTSEKDATAALNAIYQQIDGSDGNAYEDGSTDNAHAQYPWESNATTISLGDVTTSMNEGWNFEAIRRVNYFLENVDKAPMDNTLKERYKAEARFMRAFRYANMLGNFGDVPLITKTLTVEESYVARTPKAEVLQFITDELAAVAAVLPPSYAGGKNNEKGRVTKGAALALKARVHLYNGQWPLAVEAAEQVMGMGYELFRVTSEDAKDAADDYARWVDFANADEAARFRLGLRSYEKLFWQQYEENKEVILDRQHIPEKDTKFINTLLLSDDLGGWSSIAPTQSLVDAYQSFKTGAAIAPVPAAERATRYKARATDPAFYAEYRNRDPRFYASILFDEAPWNSIEDGYAFTWVKGGNNCSKTGYNFRKYVDPVAWGARIDNHANHIIIRYAEILLIYAEAKNELSGPDATVYNAIDQLRTRAGMPVLNRAALGTQALLREAIRQERRIELVLEGHRFRDIRRWKIAPHVMTNLYDLENGLVQTRKWDDRLYLMPVPQSDIDKNPKLNPNNPGYQ
ncbi:RagB/SusD family nutrient uptake outer membrane protein [Chitinophaga alhagiae]|uniref:RagB/SusD family nutrient uptake outer membrane protein n=1 Tax=Chitinophaga alhagiae TaxID=2203219 RepID=UPI000E5BD3EA|nr:RagB/SusD family nutrient uptake outer membrane protein [Chitinophaga alhagiae]